ncbi:MAG: hypothetical protein WBH86_05190 [Thermogutta sp.]|nr:hypothetical protein [Thermogutta sp.]HPU06479.1 hypothetical protein [Thermogutta sp.]HQF14212.1 hypothetical protein [Thermogutta sp.]
MRNWVVGLLLTVAATLALSGCKKAADNRPKRVPASVTVTYRGAPVEGATVTLHPTSPDGRAAFGRTNAQGQAELGTFDVNDGAIPGDYNVTVVKMEGGDQAGETPSSEIGAMPANPAGGAPPPPAAPRHLLPAKYADINTSGLRATVNASGDNKITLELTD